MLKLPLRPGMQLLQVIEAIGAIDELRECFPDRKVYAFHVAQPDPYEITCSIHVSLGLLFFTMTPVPA